MLDIGLANSLEVVTPDSCRKQEQADDRYLVGHIGMFAIYLDRHVDDAHGVEILSLLL